MPARACSVEGMGLSCLQHDAGMTILGIRESGEAATAEALQCCSPATCEGGGKTQGEESDVKHVDTDRGSNNHGQ
eukprot:4985200-Pleurochrysis_carterae.AAC.1